MRAGAALGTRKKLERENERLFFPQGTTNSSYQNQNQEGDAIINDLFGQDYDSGGGKGGARCGLKKGTQVASNHERGTSGWWGNLPFPMGPIVVRRVSTKVLLTPRIDKRKREAQWVTNSWGAKRKRIGKKGMARKRAGIRRKGEINFLPSETGGRSCAYETWGRRT